ncbi:sigma-70 family RNA polymerase sigma factor [Sphingomonas kaistensis]|uniref:RNA polymerase sigma factor n=1 Tax=Sphingomonas kaistensis TaxID=298708 RepID=A0ABZ2G267_9SPHN
MSPGPQPQPRVVHADLIAALGEVGGGSRAALNLLYERTSAKLMGICLRILHDRHEAEEVLQEVFISIWNRAGTFDPGRSSPLTWLSTIARNKAIDRLRSRRAHGADAPYGEALEIADDAPDAFAAASDREDGERILFCLSTLERRTQDMIRSAFFDGLTYSELAARAAVPLGTLKSWIRRGLQRLKVCLEG